MKSCLVFFGLICLVMQVSSAQTRNLTAKAIREGRSYYPEMPVDSEAVYFIYDSRICLPEFILSFVVV